VVQAYGSFLERTGRADEALAAYELFLRATQNNPLIEAARDRLKAGGEPAPFVQDAQAGIAEALYSIAGALTDERSIDIALVYARLALSVHPDFPEGQTLLGEIYNDMKLHQEAITAYGAGATVVAIVLERRNPAGHQSQPAARKPMKRSRRSKR
jgi:tetratricopeptide (TPR) repeat protein